MHYLWLTDWVCVAASSFPSLFCHHWIGKAKTLFHVLATLWDGDKLSLLRYVQFPLWNSSNPDKFAVEERILVTFALKPEMAAHTPTTSDPSLVVYRADREAWNSSNSAGDRDASSWAPQLTFHRWGAAPTGKPQRRAASFGTWRDNSAFLWSAACLEARPLLGEVIRLSELDQMAIWD